MTTGAEPQAAESVGSRMHHAVSLLLLIAFWALTSCGGAQSSGDRGDPLAIVKPTQEDHVAVAVPARGRARILRGPNALERKHGPRYDIWPRPFIEALRAVIAAEADWDKARDAIDREIDREGTRLTLELVEDGRVVRTLTLPVRLENLAPRALEPPPLDVRLAPTPAGLEVTFVTGGAPWFAANGCDTPWSWTWTLDRDALPPDAERVVRRVVGAWRDRTAELYARVAVAEDATVRAAVPFGVLARLAELGIPCFDLDLQGGPRGRVHLGGVELALHWLARHRTENGLWAAEAEPGAQASVRATGLALCALVGAGYTSFRGRHPHAQVIGRALESLTGEQAAEPGTHAIVAALLTKLHAATGAERLHAPTARALATLPDRWHEEASPIATGFAALALSARGEISPPVAAAFEGDLLHACRRLARSREDRELAAGAAGCVLLGDDPEAAPWRASFQSLLGRLAAAEHPDAIAVFFATIAAMRVPSDLSPPWLTQRARAASRGQAAGPIFCTGGAWDPVPGSGLGRVETTALRALESELVYRYRHAFGAPSR